MFKRKVKLMTAQLEVTEKDYFKVKEIAQKYVNKTNIHIDATEENFKIYLKEPLASIESLQSDIRIAKMFGAEVEMKISF